MTDWAAGMRCVCVDVFPHAPELADLASPVKGRVYTVRDVLFCELRHLVFLRLVEIDSRAAIGRRIAIGGFTFGINIEPGFSAEQFRPLVETRLDQFRQYLAPAPRETEDA